MHVHVEEISPRYYDFMLLLKPGDPTTSGCGQRGDCCREFWCRIETATPACHLHHSELDGRGRSGMVCRSDRHCARSRHMSAHARGPRAVGPLVLRVNLRELGIGDVYAYHSLSPFGVHGPAHFPVSTPGRSFLEANRGRCWMEGDLPTKNGS